MSMNSWDLSGFTRLEWVQVPMDTRIRLAAAPYMNGWGYDLSSARVLYDLPDDMKADGVEWGLGDRRVTNCSTLTTSPLTSVFPDCPWTLTEYGDLQVFGDRLPDHPDSPIQAAVRMKVAREVTDPPPGQWCLVQGWRTFDPSGPRYSGHAFLVRTDREGDGITVLEASSRNGIGPRYRRTTWTDLRGEYPHSVHLGVLTDP